ERLQSALAGDRQFTWEAMPDAVIIVARDLSPSAFAAMDLHKVRGVALESGGRTSHVAILARSMRLPMLMDVRGFVSAARTGDSIILDAVRGELILRPTPDRLAATSRELQDRKREEPAPAPPVAARTLDDVPISLRANTELPHEVVLARNLGAEGIGLFRSEFVFFMHPNSPPDMDEQCEIYSMLAGEMTPHPVAVRTLDTGVDRLGSQDGLPAEPNPSMGLRGIRLSLASRRLFSRQVEAIYRAAAHGNIEMVLPMVSTVEEVWEAKRIAEQVRADLQQSLGHPVAPLPLGVMIEVPAAVFTLDVIAREVDFLCVGTNDLVQYLLAVDRDNPQVAHLFQPIHPSVLQCLSRIACIANRRGIPARICGEMSSNPFFAVLLIGMGFRQLSMNAFAVPAIRSVVCKITTGQAGAIAEKVLDMTTVQEISAFLRDEVPRLLGEELGAFDADLRKRITIATETG
ncbi:MAG: phosphoenolpyruvate--protein phosphotransferase, partial [Acidobacteria bacterium]|nr:phosphoenolpyruvate--protein phosphotransferase [Acidobacteriota bacterium]